jgi:hypothetical protein
MAAWFELPYGGPERVLLSGFATAAEQGLKGSTRRRGQAAVRAGDDLFATLCGMMENGARTILLTRWRTGGRTNFELMREFAQELPNSAADEAWQRACLLAREAPLEAAREPRLKRSDETGEAPTADHPFFWAGYLLVDTSPRNGAATDEKAENPDAESGVTDAKAASEAAGQPASRIPPPGTPPQGGVAPSAGNAEPAPAGDER